jgi:hypothetical protein
VAVRSQLLDRDRARLGVHDTVHIGAPLGGDTFQLGEIHLTVVGEGMSRLA